MSLYIVLRKIKGDAFLQRGRYASACVFVASMHRKTNTVKWQTALPTLLLL